MSITQKPFGIDLIGRQMTLYTMTNRIGASVSVLDFGAHLVSVRVPDRHGRMTDVCLGYDTLEDYDRDTVYMGGIQGRYANRIGGAGFSLNGREYTLFPNEGKNTLHGGREGFQKKWWQGVTLEADGEDAVILTYIAHDGEEGFPGKMHVQVTFSWDDDCRLTLRYMAQADKDTVLNLTSHAYFNLAGQGDIMDHFLRVNAAQAVEVGSDLIPTGGFLPVAGTPLDLRAGCRLGDGIARQAECRMMATVKGYDLCYAIPGEGLREMARLWEPESGRAMRVFSDEPGLQVYTGQFLEGVGHGGVKYGPYAGVALETQHYPDSPHHPHFPTTVLKAGDTYQSATVYAFSAE